MLNEKSLFLFCTESVDKFFVSTNSNYFGNYPRDLSLIGINIFKYGERLLHTGFKRGVLISENFFYLFAAV